MPFHKLNEAELRQACKEHIETLELWVRRLIDKELTALLGAKYFESKYDGEHYLLNQKIREGVDFRIRKNQEKFPRWIDATLIEHLIDIICNSRIYDSCFKKVFQNYFKFGNEHLRIYLDRIASVRNTVYHSNPISVRDAERTICYANDIIQAIKEFYIETNKQMEYNVPTIVKYSDTMGSLDYLEDARLAQGIVLDKRNLKIRPGDKISLEIEVDASYDPSDYQIEWKTTDFDCTPFQNTRRLTITFDENHIGDPFHIQVLLTGKKEKWHRFKEFDDRLAIMFRVLPPI